MTDERALARCNSPEGPLARLAHWWWNAHRTMPCPRCGKWHDLRVCPSLFDHPAGRLSQPTGPASNERRPR